jgi:hypothetical protein
VDEIADTITNAYAARLQSLEVPANVAVLDQLEASWADGLSALGLPFDQRTGTTIIYALHVLMTRAAQRLEEHLISSDEYRAVHALASDVAIHIAHKALPPQ